MLGTVQTAAALRNLSAIKKRRQEPDDAALLAVDTVSNVQAASQAAGKTATEKAAKGPQPETVIRIGADGQRTIEYSGPVDDPRKAIATATNDPWAQYGAMVLGNEEANQVPGAAPEAAPDPFETQLSRVKEESAKILGSVPSIDDLPDDPDKLMAMAGVPKPERIWGTPTGTYRKAKREYDILRNDPLLKQKVAAANLRQFTDSMETGNKASDQLGDIQKGRNDELKAGAERAKYKDQAVQEEAQTVESWFKNTDINRFASYDEWKKSLEGAFGEFTPSKNKIATEAFYKAKADAASKDADDLRAEDDQRIQRRRLEIAEDSAQRSAAKPPTLKKASTSNTYFSSVAPETLIERAKDPAWDPDAAMENINRAANYWTELADKNSDRHRENAAKITSLETSKVNAARGLNFNLRNETEAELTRLREEQTSLKRKNGDLVQKIKKLRSFMESDGTEAPPPKRKGSLQRGSTPAPQRGLVPNADGSFDYIPR